MIPTLCAHQETICSLRFGERMAVVRNSPTVVMANSAADSARDAHALQQALASCCAELARLEADGQVCLLYLEPAFLAELRNISFILRNVSFCVC